MRHRPMEAPLFEEPSPKEEVARAHHPNGGWYHDGMDGGSQLADEYELDRLVYPAEKNKSPMHQMHEQAEHERCEKIKQVKHDAHMRSREFRITEGNVTGEDPGPPSIFDGERKK